MQEKQALFHKSYLVKTVLLFMKLNQFSHLIDRSM